jgi:hypothetical protein
VDKTAVQNNHGEKTDDFINWGAMILIAAFIIVGENPILTIVKEVNRTSLTFLNRVGLEGLE